MTCHARAAMDRAGGFLPLFSTDPPSPGQKACGGAVHTAYVGAPSPGWFGGGDATEFTQGDFVWALGDASPAGP
jgi:hypothetical protein